MLKANVLRYDITRKRGVGPAQGGGSDCRA